MIKKHLKLLIITTLVILLPIVAGLALWNQLPEQMPFHWNAEGVVDGWSSKPFAVFGMPVILAGFHWLCVLGTAADPKKKNHADKMLQVILWFIPVLNIVLSVITYATALGQPVRVEIVMPIFIGMIFTIIGNYMPKCKQNYTIGIKIPWTLHSEENWNRTHRFAGWLWTACGIVVMLTGIFSGFAIFFAVVLAMILAPVIYSYILHRKGI